MGAYHPVRLPDTIERGATGGGEFRTNIIELSSGLEKRNITWAQARPRYNIGYGIQEAEEFYAIRNFFYARFGSAFSFAFRDFGDFQIPDDLDGVQEIALGDAIETVFQIIKTYTSGLAFYNRIIEKPIETTVKVFFDEVEQLSGWSVNDDTGLVTFVTPPGNGISIGVQCEFDVPVRFENDRFDLTLEQIRAGAIPNLPVIGVFGERI